MQANWSLILNVLLLTGVVIAIVRMLRAKRSVEVPARHQQPSVGAGAEKIDDVIAVRKVTRDTPMPSVMQAAFSPASSATLAASQPTLHARMSTQQHDRFHTVSAVKQTPVQEPEKQDVATVQPKLTTPSAEPPKRIELEVERQEPVPTIEQQTSAAAPSLVIFLLAKENRQLAGYELLQTILSAGLRFGEGHLFHRHQYANGQGPIMCSLATATASGVFDLQNIGAFSVHGLCMFMQSSGSPSIDMERFSIMVDTARQLSDGLDTHMLDDKRCAWSDASEQRYMAMLNVADTVGEFA